MVHCLFDDTEYAIYRTEEEAVEKIYFKFLGDFFFREDLCSKRENDWMFIQAVLHQLWGEDVPESAFIIDPNLDIEKEACTINLTNYPELSKYNKLENTSYYECIMIRYAVQQAENGEFKEVAICPFSGLEAVWCPIPATPDELYSIVKKEDFPHRVYCNTQYATQEDVQLFFASAYLQIVENPDTSWLVEQQEIWEGMFNSMHIPQFLSCLEFPEIEEYKIDPDYYKWHPSVECVKVAQEFNFNLGNAIKYIWRSGGPITKGLKLEDLNKATRYLQFEIERLENEFQD